MSALPISTVRVSASQPAAARHVATSILTLTACAFAVSVVSSAPADARGGRGLGGVLGGAIGVGGAMILLNEAAKASGAQVRRPSSGGGTRSRGKSRSTDDDDDDDDESGPAARRAIINAKAVEDIEKQIAIEANRNAELRRDVEAAVRGFIKSLFDWHAGLREQRKGDGVVLASINQVTEGEVRRLLDEVYFSGSKLTQFDRFAGEMWTRDRLMVEVLAEAKKVLRPYFHGPGAKGPSMDDLKRVFEDAAGEVHARALELNEIVGVSYSFRRFLGSISESAGRVDASLVTIGADAHYEGLLRRAIDSIDPREFVKIETVAVADQKGLNRQFQFRYRARRALYDCLSKNYVEMMTGEAPQRDTAIPAGIIQIDTIQTGSDGAGGQPTRGARLPQTVSTVAGVAPVGRTLNQQDAWLRLIDQVKARCFGKVETLAKAVVSQGLEPLQARTDIDETLGGSDIRSQLPAPGLLQPILVQPRQ